jgi:hypothetical protein
MSRSRFFVCVAAGLSIAVSGCGGDDAVLGVNAGDQLTDAEIQALFNELGTAIGGLGAVPHVVAAQDGPMLAPSGTISIDQSVDESAPCESGTIGIKGDVEGTVDDESFEADLSMRLTLSFNDCAVSAETQTITLANPPGLVYDMDFLMGEESFSTSGTQIGGFDFTTGDGRTGSCAIDLSFDVSYTMGSGTQNSTITGEVCGRSAANFQPYTGT